MESQQSKIAWLLPALLGGVGLWQANEQGKKQDRALANAEDLDRRRLELEEPLLRRQADIANILFNLAENYNPQGEIDRDVDYASKKTQQTIEQALRNMNAEYRSSGGTPGDSTEFNVRAQGMTNDIADPLREYAARMQGSATQRKIAAYQSAIGAPAGSMGDVYRSLSDNATRRSQMYAPGDPSGSLGMIANAFQAPDRRSDLDRFSKARWWR